MSSVIPVLSGDHAREPDPPPIRTVEMRTKRPHLTLLLAVVGLLAAACGSGGDATTTVAVAADDTTTTAAPATTTTAPGTTTTVTGTTTVAADPMAGIHAAETELGTILVDGDGFTLYVFTVDGGGGSACNDACAELWPPVPADSEVSPGLDTAIFGEITRDDGTTQLTINGMPLYRYGPDTSPGDVNGQGFNDVWFVVDPAGSMVGPEAADEVDVVIDYDY